MGKAMGDPGHGGIDEKGNYTTAPSKMVKWEGKSLHMDTPFFYEGVFNRQMEDLISEEIKNWGHEYYSTVPKAFRHYDVELPQRTATANRVHDQIGIDAFISFHANAGGGTGFEIFTFPGDSDADILATFIFREMERECSGFMKFRKDLSDGDPDKEAKFWVLRKTKMPAVLIEFGFMDTWSDVVYMMTPSKQMLMAKAVARGYQRFFEYKNQ